MFKLIDIDIVTTNDFGTMRMLARKNSPCALFYKKCGVFKRLAFISKDSGLSLRVRMFQDTYNKRRYDSCM